MRERFDVVGQLDTELTRPSGCWSPAATFRPRPPALGRALLQERPRASASGAAGRALAPRAARDRADVVFQTHALFGPPTPAPCMYVDCTHRQSMEQWPDWNPLRGRALDRWLDRERRQYQRAAHVFAFSEETAAPSSRTTACPRDRVSVVGAGVNFERAARARRPPDVGPPTVLFVGNDFERKGGPQLLEAFAGLRAGCPEARLRIVGTPHAMPGPGRRRGARPGRTAATGCRRCTPRPTCSACRPLRPLPRVLLEAMARAPGVVTRLRRPRDASTAHRDRRRPDGRRPRRRPRAWSSPRGSRLGRPARVEERSSGPRRDRMAPARALAHPTPSPPPALVQHPNQEHAMTRPTPVRRSPPPSDRPWGAFEQFSLNQPTVKIITVSRARLSLQRHEHRASSGRSSTDHGHRGRRRRWTASTASTSGSAGTHRMGNSGQPPGSSSRLRPLRRGGHRAPRGRLRR